MYNHIETVRATPSTNNSANPKCRNAKHSYKHPRRHHAPRTRRKRPSSISRYGRSAEPQRRRTTSPSRIRITTRKRSYSANQITNTKQIPETIRSIQLYPWNMDQANRPRTHELFWPTPPSRPDVPNYTSTSPVPSKSIDKPNRIHAGSTAYEQPELQPIRIHGKLL
jgi:hypothetical protein